MTSNFIYQSSKVLPYVYMCVERGTGKIYIGYRYKNRVPSSDDFGIHYFTSNEYVKKHFQNFEIYIVAEFFVHQDAYKFESTLIKEMNGPNLINNEKYAKQKKYEKIVVDTTERPCPLFGCGKMHNNWRYDCCSLQHQRMYSAKKRYGTENLPNLSKEDIKKYQKIYRESKRS